MEVWVVGKSVGYLLCVCILPDFPDLSDKINPPSSFIIALCVIPIGLSKCVLILPIVLCSVPASNLKGNPCSSSKSSSASLESWRANPSSVPLITKLNDSSVTDAENPLK